MSESVEFNRVPYGGESGAETLFREYIGQLLAHLDVTRVRLSCARERALVTAVRGAYDASGNNSRAEPIRLAEVFDRFKEVFGWYGDDAELLALWMGMVFDREAFELLQSDPYLQHEAFWKRCSDQGYDSFMLFWGRQADPFDGVVALIDDAAKVLGDE